MEQSKIEKWFEEVATRIASLPDKKLQNSFALALKDSLYFDPNDIKGIKSPTDILYAHKVSINEQKEYKISLTKSDAFEFLTDYGKNLKKAGFYKNFSSSKYKTTFKRRKVPKAGNALIFSYSEWLYLVDYEFPIEFPKSIEKFLQ